MFISNKIVLLLLITIKKNLIIRKKVGANSKRFEIRWEWRVQTATSVHRNVVVGVKCIFLNQGGNSVSFFFISFQGKCQKGRCNGNAKWVFFNIQGVVNTW